MKTLLSTRKLSPSQRDLILGRGHAVVDYNAIQIIPLDFEAPKEIDKLIFTSGNAVRLFFEKTGKQIPIKEIYCVGIKTEQKLIEYGQKVTMTANNSSELGQYLIKKYQNQDFLFVCSEQRLDILPDLLKSAKNHVFELKIYQIKPVLHRFDQKFDGILFFSPSGVDSYFQNNTAGKSPLICIGETTAKEAALHTENVWIAKQATVESVIAKTIKVLNNDQE
ncbi:uroporphyrinogen-III synthase [Aureitalea marina]|uniref:Tetrapyrrole biosynthesis uroporphyrinogen III synthase domain-containing protein n=1 Tax=Aureitalea marina TaxID=930804 RepID=A0A2S7KSD8_9FLAO|nr:uroporphyrinogen-III synthase [Aureitalea marina]PQB05542.1 hypothetical protein BST85_12020 [Aureitalea marina]